MGVWCYAKVYFVSGLHFCNPYREWSPVLLCFLRLFGLHFLTRELGAEIIEAGLQMSYNLCNLPKQITAEDGTLVNYTYFADGTKFKAVNSVGNGFVYTCSLRWSVENGVFTPESVVITGGRAVFENNSNRISKSQS